MHSEVRDSVLEYRGCWITKSKTHREWSKWNEILHQKTPWNRLHGCQIRQNLLYTKGPMTFYQKSKSRSLRDEIYYLMNALVSEGVGELGAVFTLLSLFLSLSLSLSLSLCLSHPYLLSISAAACLHIAFEKKRKHPKQ